jgi:signal peptidase II
VEPESRSEAVDGHADEPRPAGTDDVDTGAAGAAHDDTAPSEAATASTVAIAQDHRPRLWPLFGMVAAVGLTLDVATKWEAVDRLEPNVPVRVLGPLLSFRLIRNPGAAFSQGEGITWVFAVAAILVVAFVLVRLVPRLGHVGWAVALGLLVAGVTGNLVDRIFRQPGPFRGHVVDFLELPHWPIFNVADMCITAAAVMVIVLSIFRNVGIDGRRPGEDEEPGDQAPRRRRFRSRAADAAPSE